MEVDSNGWQLLSTLSLLVREGDAVAEVPTYANSLIFENYAIDFFSF